MFTVMMPNNQSPLISAEEAAKKLNDQSTKFFDVRGRWSEDIQCSRQAFLSEHITGARFLDWTKTFVNTDLPIALAPVADIEQAQADLQHWVLTKTILSFSMMITFICSPVEYGGRCGIGGSQR